VGADGFSGVKRQRAPQTARRAPTHGGRGATVSAIALASAELNTILLKMSSNLYVQP